MLVTLTHNFTTGSETAATTYDAHYMVVNITETIINEVKFKFENRNASTNSYISVRVLHNNILVFETQILLNDLRGGVYTWKPNLKTKWMDNIYIQFHSAYNLAVYSNSDYNRNFCVLPRDSNAKNCIMAMTVTTEQFAMINDSNNGYPYTWQPPDTSVFVGYEPPRPLNSWKIDSNNKGYPWSWGFTEATGGSNIFFKTANGLVPLTAYYKNTGGLIPLAFSKIKE